MLTADDARQSANAVRGQIRRREDREDAGQANRFRTIDRQDFGRAVGASQDDAVDLAGQDEVVREPALTL